MPPCLSMRGGLDGVSLEVERGGRLGGRSRHPLALPAGYALGRLKLPWRVRPRSSLLPQAVPNRSVYVNIAPVLDPIGLNATIAGVVPVQALAMVGR